MQWHPFFTDRLIIGGMILGLLCLGNTSPSEDKLSLPVTEAAPGALFESQIYPAAESNFLLALFRLWLPQVTSPVAGILVVLPGSNADGTPLANDPQWQAVARKWNFALLAISFTTRSSTPSYYCAESGSGQALLAALDELAAASGHPELKQLPMAILGHSQGGQFALHFACWKPERVRVFATIKGGFYHVQPTDAARAVPGLLITAEQDAEFRQKNIRSLFDANNTPVSRWTFASEAKIDHQLGRSLDFILPFFDAVITGNLHPYSGDLRTLAIQPAKRGQTIGRTWLPCREVAEIWSHFCSGNLAGPKQDLHIPASPFPPFAQVSPATCDLGNIETRKEIPTAVFHVSHAPGDPAWNSIRAFSILSRCDVSVSGSGGDWLVSAMPRLDLLPFGRIEDSIFIRYFNGGDPIFGGCELSVSLNHTAPDLKLSATSLYLGVHTQACQKTIEFTVPADKPLRIKSVELVKGVGVGLSTTQHTLASATLVAEFKALPESGDHSGIIAVHFVEPFPGTVLIPFVGLYRRPDKPTNSISDE